MAEEVPENTINTPDFDETDKAAKKSTISLITGEVKAAGLQVKPTIDNFYRLITEHYANKIRLNEMTGKPEWYDKLSKRWREWTDAQESEARAYFESTYNMYSQAKLSDAFLILFSVA